MVFLWCSYGCPDPLRVSRSPSPGPPGPGLRAPLLARHALTAMFIDGRKASAVAHETLEPRGVSEHGSEPRLDGKLNWLRSASRLWELM